MRVHVRQPFEGEADQAATARVRTRSAVRPLSAARHAAALPAFIEDGVASYGEELDASVRAELEPRLGHDFGHVRVHSDPSAQRSARALNAHAYTAGTDIVFGSGEYAPQTAQGRQLIAHELTHVVQQASGAPAPAVQAKLKSPLFSLDPYLMDKGIDDFTLAGDEYGHLGRSAPDLEQQIVADLLYSPRVFNVLGGTQSEAETNLDNHVSAREGVVKFAKKKRYKFAAGAATKMNRAYWARVGGTWHVKSGVDQLKAMKDVNVHPREYAISCKRATDITLTAGSGGSPMAMDWGVAVDDWIAGEAGYIENLAYTGDPADAGLEGENIIATGDIMSFWGHFGPGDAYRSYDEWFKEVESWNGAAATQDYRRRPARGLA